MAKFQWRCWRKYSVLSPIRETLQDLLAKAQGNLAIDESVNWRKSYWRNSEIPFISVFNNGRGQLRKNVPLFLFRTSIEKKLSFKSCICIYIYSKTSVSEHLYLVNTSCLNAYLSPPDQFLLQIDLYLVNNSQL